jgi:hypothetical protein
LAQNALQSSRGKLDHVLSYMSTRLLTRDLDPKERAIVMRSYDDYLTYYKSDTADAAKLISIGESKANPELPAPQLAALTMVANELMNLDEVLVK